MKLIAFVKESKVSPTLRDMGVDKGWGNGYVAIPKGHPCHGLTYNEIHRKYDIDVNGGLTFASNVSPEWAKRDDLDGMWVVGFDTAHYGDTLDRWPNEESVRREAENLKEQLEQIL